MIKKWFSIAVIVLILVIVAVTQLPTPAYAQTQGQCWALVIGVADYQDPLMQDVGSACFNGFYQELAGFWGEDHVLFLQDDQASKQNIKNQIQGWLDSSENAQDTVLVFLSGHGNDGIFAPWDTSYWSNSNVITDTELKSWLSCLESRKQIFILMSCLSGSFINALSADGRVVLTSSAEDESSWGDSSGAYFTFYLTDGFDDPETVDTNHDGEVSAEELFEYARPKTTSRAVLWLNYQHPQINDKYKGEAALRAKLIVISEHGQTTGSGWGGLFRSAQISVDRKSVV